MGQFRIGWAEVDITPAKKVSLVGQFAERISEYVEKPLTATALAMTTEDEQVVMCSCDLVGISYVLADTVRGKLANNGLGLDPMKVIISAIHTHTGPGYAGRGNSARKLSGTSSSGFRALLESELPPDKKYVESANVTQNPEIATDEELLAFLSDRIAQCVLEAWKKLAPGGFSNAFGRAAVGMCRRACYSDGTAQMWGDTDTAVFTQLEGGNDSGIELLYTFDGEGQLSGIVANLACPAQCVQHRLFVSPDFWGEAKMLVRRHFGDHVFLLPQCSAAGDQCPVDLIRWVEPESDVHDPNLKRNNPPRRKADPSMFDLAGMRKAGKRIADEIINVYDEGLDAPQTSPELVHQVHMMQLPIRRATLTEVINARREIRDYLQHKSGDTVDYNDAAALQVYLGILRRAELQDKLDILDTEVHIIRLGTVAIATNPFELFLDYGNQIKARSFAEQTFLVQLANGTEGYLPTEKAEKGGHYSAFISSGLVGHAGGEMLVRETLKNINGLFAE
ncbi:MAG: hypothetical protein J5602_02365 [Clostridia bacterium]|nr:hypothetical protein [Clostridia bacterium]MBO4884134.1 hypothetical protein [Clostridia bacterium]